MISKLIPCNATPGIEGNTVEQQKSLIKPIIKLVRAMGKGYFKQSIFNVRFICDARTFAFKCLHEVFAGVINNYN